MELKHVRAKLWEIGKTYPLLLGLLQKSIDRTGKQTVGNHWAELLKDLNQFHFDDVCHEFADLRIELPDPIDRLPMLIRQMTSERAAIDEKRLEQHAETIRYRLVKSGRSEAREMNGTELMEAWRDQR